MTTERNKYLVERHSTEWEKNYWKWHGYELPTSLVEFLEQVEVTALAWERIKNR